MPGLLYLLTAIAGICLFSTGCTNLQQPSEPYQLPPPPENVHLAAKLQSGDLRPPADKREFSTSAPLTLPEARQLVKQRSPALAAAWHAIQVQSALQRQARLPLNPEISAELEEFAGSGEFSGIDNASARVGLSREILTGAKQKMALQAAEVEFASVLCSYRSLLNELAIQVETRFYAVYFLQEELKLKCERLELLEETGEIIRKRVNAGERSSLDLLKQQTEQTDAVLSVKKTRRQLLEAQATLASTWGELQPRSLPVTSEWQRIPPLSIEILQNAMKTSPAWQNSQIEISRANAALAVEQSRKYPNVEVEGGFQHSRENDNWALFVGVSMPLPIFDRNQGNIAAAQAKLHQVKAETDALDLELQHALRRAWQHWQNAEAALNDLEQECLPAAKQYHDAIFTAYQAGEADILELFDSRHNWLAKREELLELKQECETNRLEMLALIGLNDLNELTRNKE
ncbi:MAG: TolC family protein [Lentisphaeria bacterium]|nr:TolC family protein [Lentisphaeria bacterium]